MTWRDSCGVEIEVGDTVAFNRSGQVIEGKVLHLTQREARIQATNARYGIGRISRVKNATSIMVL